MQSLKDGLISDGKKSHEANKIMAKLGVINKSPGSAYVEQGNTKVLAAVYGPQEIKAKNHSQKMLLNCQYSMAGGKKPQNESILKDFTRNLRLIFESVIISQFYASSQIDIFIEILEDGGSTLATSVNAATLALVDAGIKLKGLVCSCSCGSISNKSLVDMTREEEEQSSFHLTVATLPSVFNQVLMIELKGKLEESQLDIATETASKACKEISNSLNEICLKMLKKSDE